LHRLRASGPFSAAENPQAPAGKRRRALQTARPTKNGTRRGRLIIRRRLDPMPTAAAGCADKPVVKRTIVQMSAAGPETSCTASAREGCGASLRHILRGGVAHAMRRGGRGVDHRRRCRRRSVPQSEPSTETHTLKTPLKMPLKMLEMLEMLKPACSPHADHPDIAQARLDQPREGRELESRLVPSAGAIPGCLRRWPGTRLIRRGRYGNFWNCERHETREEKKIRHWLRPFALFACFVVALLNLYGCATLARLTSAVVPARDTAPAVSRALRRSAPRGV